MESKSPVQAYYSHLTTALGRLKDINVVAVAHMVPNTLTFAPAVNSLANLAAILAKPKNKDRHEAQILSDVLGFNLKQELSRDWAEDADSVVAFLNDLGLANKKVVLVDIGGYFHKSVDEISEKFSGTIVGVLEGTENGAQKYENLPSRTPKVTVARSPLKLPEDYLIASSIVFSIEAVLREHVEILQTRKACVIGYGRVGSSVAEILRNRGIMTTIHDREAIKNAEAAAKGFEVMTDREQALKKSSLVVCATGDGALDLRGFGALPDGCVVASVTSADDEFNFENVEYGYSKSEVQSNLVKYSRDREGTRRKVFYMVNDGDAANFIHGAVVGPAMQLIEGEKLAAIKCLVAGNTVASNTNLKHLPEVPYDVRTKVAEIWNEHFLTEDHVDTIQFDETD